MRPSPNDDALRAHSAGKDRNAAEKARRREAFMACAWWVSATLTTLAALTALMFAVRWASEP